MRGMVVGCAEDGLPHARPNGRHAHQLCARARALGMRSERAPGPAKVPEGINDVPCTGCMICKVWKTIKSFVFSERVCE